MPFESRIQDITHVIQLAVAPVFLLTAVGTILNVFATRLGRIVDRARKLGEGLGSLQRQGREAADEELRLLARRRHLVNSAITLGTTAALLVCVVIAVAFLGFILHANFAGALAGLFVAAMLAFIGALVLFLREVLLAATAPGLWTGAGRGPEA
jgi:hypothetical protein